LQIALQLAEGRSNREAAEALFLSPKTVERSTPPVCIASST
jgi:DNA-binding CsgD family transcriptional regulator